MDSLIPDFATVISILFTKVIYPEILPLESNSFALFSSVLSILNKSLSFIAVEKLSGILLLLTRAILTFSNSSPVSIFEKAKLKIVANAIGNNKVQKTLNLSLKRHLS